MNPFTKQQAGVEHPRPLLSRQSHKGAQARQHAVHTVNKEINKTTWNTTVAS